MGEGSIDLGAAILTDADVDKGDIDVDAVLSLPRCMTAIGATTGSSDADTNNHETNEAKPNVPHGWSQ